MRNVKILVAPLDWGLGHATRCIPIINELLKAGCEVSIAAEGEVFALLQKEFPIVQFLDLPGYRIFYHSIKSIFRWKIALQIPRIMGAIRRENRWLNTLLQTHSFDAVISDNRFGLHHPALTSIFITHQLQIQSGTGKWVDRWLRRINFRHISRFNECWIPDYKGEVNLAGNLSHSNKLPGNAYYIGPLSRFKKIDTSVKYDLLMLLSGPEPSRTDWEKSLLNELTIFEGKTLFVRGLPGVCECEAPFGSERLDIVNHLSASELNMVIEQAEWVICRSGYTSVMDLVALEHRAILVPTPGQPEQEYLAAYLHQNKIFCCINQESFSIKKAIEEATSFPFNFSAFEQTAICYKQQVKALIENIQAKKLQ
ncbi:MAG: glycosyltransferase [Agriterribacter sp.]